MSINHFWNPARQHTACILWFLVPMAIVFTVILQFNHGAFSYSLDDPYIHMAVAKNMFYHGVYGINAHEFSSPSSSIIWPFLLLPFAGTPVFYYVPLLINATCCTLSGFIFFRLLEPHYSPIKTTVLSLFLLVSLELYVAVFTGMEHSLQVLLTLYIAMHLIKGEHRFPQRRMFYLALILLPLVRYEGLAISGPVLLVQVFDRDPKVRMRAFITGVILVSLVLAFSLFLYTNGGQWLPSSVLAKHYLSPLQPYSNYTDIWMQIVDKMFEDQGIFFILMFILLGLTFGEGDYRKGTILSLVILSYFIAGSPPTIPLSRYFIFFISFFTVLMIDVYLDYYPKGKHLLFLMPCLFLGAMLRSAYIPTAASNIYHQQWIMGKLVKELDENVAVNDLGLVALHSDQYVLDLWGLGSFDALKMRKDLAQRKQWISHITREHDVHYMMIYDKWFPNQVPENFVKVTELYLNQTRVSPAGSWVSFYATDQAHANKLKQLINGFEFSGDPNSYEFLFEWPDHHDET